MEINKNDEAYLEINRRRRLTKYAYIYAATDFALTFVIILASFLAFYGYDGFGNHLFPVLIYAGSLAIATVLVFLIFKVYRFIINKNFGLSESMRILILVLAVHVIGIVFVSVLPVFDYSYKDIHGHNYIWSWGLSTSTIILFLISSRFVLKAA